MTSQAKAAALAEYAIGPALVGAILNFALYGVMICQTSYWFMRFSRNATLWMKLFVGYLLVADSLHSIFVATFLYQSLVVHFTDLAHLNRMTWVFATDPGLTGIIGGSVQLFYAYRIAFINKMKRIAILVSVMAIVNMLCGIGTSIACVQLKTFDQLYKMKVVGIFWLGSAFTADIIITITMVRHINTLKNGMVATDAFVNRIIMRLFLQTGMLTALFAITDLMLYLTLASALHLIFNLPLAKLYTNSLMSILNSGQSGYSRKKIHFRTGSKDEPVEFTTGQQFYADDQSLELTRFTTGSEPAV